MNLMISNTSHLAIYEQIMEQIKDAIIKQELRADEALPSIRSLARDLQISVITTSRAYEELQAEGLIYSLPGKGFYVSPFKTELLKEKKIQALEDQMLELIRQCKSANLAREDMITMIRLLYDNEQEA
ncbi:GntR family transcriptional regulator [Anaerotaenia torta]|uniref:GntR family transcriptional regulator n=1 Tax=Anaerotaenia torta TaxID=433293 RepID=UPI003D213E42